MKAAGEASLQTGTVCMKHWWGVGMLLGTNFSHWVHLSVSTVVYDSVSPILYNPTLLFRLNFVISCHAQLETLACAKMRAVCWGKTSEKPWQKKDRYHDNDIILLLLLLFLLLLYIYRYHCQMVSLKCYALCQSHLSAKLICLPIHLLEQQGSS